MRLALSVHLAEQVNVVGQPLRRILHLIFQLLLLCRARPSGKSSPYRSKIDDRVMRIDHRYGMGHDGDSGVSVEAIEVLPHRLAPIDYGVQTWRPVIGLRHHLHVDTVEHRLDSSHHDIEFSPLGSRL